MKWIRAVAGFALFIAPVLAACELALIPFTSTDGIKPPVQETESGTPTPSPTPAPPTRLPDFREKPMYIDMRFEPTAEDTVLSEGMRWNEASL